MRFSSPAARLHRQPHRPATPRSRARRHGLRQPLGRPPRRPCRPSGSSSATCATSITSTTCSSSTASRRSFTSRRTATSASRSPIPAKYYTNNLVYTLNLIDRCRRNGVGKFVFSSTCATYGVPAAVPITEDEKQTPINPYGNTKLAVERALCRLRRAYPFGFCALRYFNASGAAADGIDRRGPRPRDAPDPARLAGRARPAAARRDLRHRLPDARRHLHSRLHPRRRPGRGAHPRAGEDRAGQPAWPTTSASAAGTASAR